MAEDFEPGNPGTGGIFFSGASRSLLELDEIKIISVGVDIGSSTSHLLFSRIRLQRENTRYRVTGREVLYQSAILLTPYRQDQDIDTELLHDFIEREYASAGITRDEVDTGALILTGVAVRRKNARAIADLFAREAGKFVAVSAGDRLEAMLAARGSGALKASEGGQTILNIDIGGGTTKLAICRAGKIVALTVVEAGARLIACDSEGCVTRLEKFGAQYGKALGMPLALGERLDAAQKKQLAQAMSANIVSAMRGEAVTGWLRLPNLPSEIQFDGVLFSGGVSEYTYRNSEQDFDDLGPMLGEAQRNAVEAAGIPVLEQSGGIRATVIGASQYTVQLSGSTIYLDPLDALPQLNIATIEPDMSLAAEILDSAVIADAVRAALARIDNQAGSNAVAVAIRWQGSATYARLEALSTGLLAGLASVLAAGHPLILVSDGDMGGLLGMHIRENSKIDNALISIDGITLAEFDFIDIGTVLLDTGSVPVVVKSLVFPTE